MKSVFPVPLYRKPGSIPNPLRSNESVVERQGAHFPAFRGIFQHEFDHLDGILFIIKLSMTDKMRSKRALARLEKEYADRKKPAR